MRFLRYFLGGALFSIPTILMAAPASTSTDYGIIIQRFKQATSSFSDVIIPSALWLFGALVTLDVILWIFKLLPIENLEKFIKNLAMRIGYYSFLLALILTDWLLDIVMGFVKLGEKGAGFQGFKPTDMMVDGLNIIAGITNKTNAWDIVTNPFAAFILGLCIIIMLATFAILVAQYIIIWIQLYIYIAVNPILLSLGALSYTKDIGMKVISTVIVIGTRFLTIYMVIAISRQMVPYMSEDIASSTLDNLGPLYSAVGMAIVLLILAIKSPTIASELLNGTSSLSAGDAMLPGAAAAAGAAAGAVAGGLSSAGSAAAQGSAALREAVGAAFSGGASSNTGGMYGMTSAYNPTYKPESMESMGGTRSAPSWMGSDNTSPSSGAAGSSSGAAGRGPAVSFNRKTNSWEWEGEAASTPASGGSIGGGANQPAQGFGGNFGGNGGQGAASSLSEAASTPAGGDFIGGGASQPAQGFGGNVGQGTASSLGEAASIPAGGGTIGGADTTSQTSQQQSSSTVADHVTRGMQEFAQAEKSPGASVNINLGHEEI